MSVDTGSPLAGLTVEQLTAAIVAGVQAATAPRPMVATTPSVEEPRGPSLADTVAAAKAEQEANEKLALDMLEAAKAAWAKGDHVTWRTLMIAVDGQDPLRPASDRYAPPDERQAAHAAALKIVRKEP